MRVRFWRTDRLHLLVSLGDLVPVVRLQQRAASVPGAMQQSSKTA